MHHPIIVGALAAGYVAGAAAWVYYVLGGWTVPRRGRYVPFAMDVVSTALWPVAVVVLGCFYLDRGK